MQNGSTIDNRRAHGRARISPTAGLYDCLNDSGALMSSNAFY
jgi:hypothetical protein